MANELQAGGTVVALGTDPDGQLLAGLPSTLKSHVRLRLAADYSVIGMELRPGSNLSAVGWDDLQDAAGSLSRSLSPAEASAIMAALAACDAVTMGRDADQIDMKARAMVFARDLAEFPGDAIRAAFREHARNSRWRPTLAEIREHCAKAVQPTKDALALVRSEMGRRNLNREAS